MARSGRTNLRFDRGTWEQVNASLRERHRVTAGRKAQPTAAIIDSQSARTTEAGGPRGYDGGKKVSGRKRHILVDTEGNLLKARVHPADIQVGPAFGPTGPSRR